MQSYHHPKISPSQAPASSATSAVITTPVRGRLLMAEDNPVNQFVVEEMLSQLGYTVDFARAGLRMLRMTRARNAWPPG